MVNWSRTCRRTDNQGHVILQPPYELVNGQILLKAQIVDIAGNTSNLQTSPRSRPAGRHHHRRLQRRRHGRSVNLPALDWWIRSVHPRGHHPPHTHGRNCLRHPVPSRLRWRWTCRLRLLPPFDLDLGHPAQPARPANPGVRDRHRGSNRAIPMVGDINGDGVADLSLFDPTTATWYVSLTGVGDAAPRQLGQPGDIPVLVDYERTGPERPGRSTTPVPGCGRSCSAPARR